MWNSPGYTGSVKNLESEFADQGWTQMLKRNTHYTNRNGAVSESLIDHIWTPVKVKSYGQEEIETSDHKLVWVDKFGGKSKRDGKKDHEKLQD